METPCERPETVETCRSDCMERGKSVNNVVSTFCFILYFNTLQCLFLLEDTVTLHVHHIDQILQEICTYNFYMKSYTPVALVPIEINLPIYLVIKSKE